MIRKLVKTLSNLPGWRTNRKIIVIESDDWGSIRMPSRNAFQKLINLGLICGDRRVMRYSKNDTLASKNDLSLLYEVLASFKGKDEKHPVFTAVTIVANPNFEAIRASNFEKYEYESFDHTLERYNQKSALSLWYDGIHQRLFVPQFHAREHLNVSIWMRALQANDVHTHLAFDEGMWAFNNSHPLSISYQAAFDLEKKEDLDIQADAIKQGLQVFEKLFDYRASFFVPPNGPFNNSLEKIAHQHGIQFMSTSKIQNEVLGAGKTRKRFHYLGQRNKQGQIYLTRNCFFEPTDRSKDWVDSCLNDIHLAFRWHKPAVISSHRVNYIGGLNEKNRDIGLTQLTKLLNNIIKHWPNVEFMTSTELGALIDF